MDTGLKITMAMALLAGGTQAHGFDAISLAGLQRATKDDLLDSSTAQGYVAAMRSHGRPGSQEFFAIGLAVEASLFDIAVDESGSSTTITGEGDYVGYASGPDLELSYPGGWLTPFVHFSYLYGQFRYEAASSTEVDQSGTTFETDVETSLVLERRGVAMGVGLRLGEEMGFIIEYNETYETLTVNDVSTTYVNRVNGIVQPRDVSRDQYDQTLEHLKGEKFGRSAASLLIGLDWRN